VDSKNAWKSYSIGPPYLLHRNDALRLSMHWTDFMFGYTRTL
jgi:hypothetical protein